MNRWVRISCEGVAAQQAERAAEHLHASKTDPQRLLDVVRCLHTSLIGAMTAALNGTAGVGALEEKWRLKAIAALNDGEIDFEERTLSFSGLLAAIQAPGRLPWSDSLELTSEELSALRELDGLRALIDHPKPTSWSIAEPDGWRARSMCSSLLPRQRRAGGPWATACWAGRCGR